MVVFSQLFGGSGKTSLAFRYAYNVAQEDVNAGTVYFVAQRHKLQNQLPLPPPPPYANDPDVLKRIKMKYVSITTSHTG